MMTTWEFTRKFTSGHILEGLTQTDTLTADAVLGAPFAVGQHVDGIGGPYVIISIREV
jgi:hypothetical protein